MVAMVRWKGCVRTGGVVRGVFSLLRKVVHLRYYSRIALFSTALVLGELDSVKVVALSQRSEI